MSVVDNIQQGGVCVSRTNLAKGWTDQQHISKEVPPAFYNGWKSTALDRPQTFPKYGAD